MHIVCEWIILYAFVFYTAILFMIKLLESL